MTENKYLRYIFLSTSIIAFILIVIVLKTLKTIFIPMLFALFISFMFAPINRLLIKRKMPVIIRLIVLGVILTFLISAIAFIGSLGINHFMVESPKYFYKMQDLILSIAEYLHLSPHSLMNIQTAQVDMMMFFDQMSINNIISRVMNNFMSFFSYFILTLFFTIFIVSDNNHLFKKIIKAFCKNSEFANKISVQIEKQLVLYILNKTMINLLSSISSALLLYGIGVDFPILSGILIFVFGFIPEIGSVTAALFPIAFCFFEFGMSWQLIVCISSLLVINSTFGNYIEPRLMGRQFNLSPIIVLVSLVFWAWVWGPLGMFIAVPLTSIINIMLVELNRFSVFTDIIRYEKET